ncbi:hypothetical protein PMAG_a0290 [Pseudoalteromonas mariniglutinosa NCIMB 1770]|nr:hypothetical protein [Pseudoalteromonas mariniglutinosa NCIMB 1770]
MSLFYLVFHKLTSIFNTNRVKLLTIYNAVSASFSPLEWLNI